MSVLGRMGNSPGIEVVLVYSGSGMMTDNEVPLLLLLLLLLQLLHHLLTISYLSFSFGPLHIRSHPENPISRSASEGSSSGYSTEGELE